MSKGISLAGRPSSKKTNEFNYVENLEKFGLDNVNPSEENLTGVNGSFLSFTLLRHLKIRDLKRQVGEFRRSLSLEVWKISFNYFYFLGSWCSQLLSFDWTNFDDLRWWSFGQARCYSETNVIFAFFKQCGLFFKKFFFLLFGFKFTKSYERNGKWKEFRLPLVYAQHAERFQVEPNVLLIHCDFDLKLFVRLTRVAEDEFIEFSEIDNHDDFYTTDGHANVHVQDQRGYFIVYDVALHDLK